MGSAHRVRCDFYLHENNPVHKLIIETFGETFLVDENSSKAHAKRDVILNALWFTALSMKGERVVAKRTQPEPLSLDEEADSSNDDSNDDECIPDDIMKKMSF